LIPSAAISSSGLIDLCDAGVLQPYEQLGFLLEAPQMFGAGCSQPDHLKGDSPLRVLLLRPVDSAHAAFPNQTENAVCADVRMGLGREAAPGRHASCAG
jgi:hypothetical protein